MTIPPVLPSGPATVGRSTLRLAVGTLAGPAIAVALAAVLLATYVSLAAHRLGLGSLAALGIFVFVVIGVVSLWLKPAARFDSDGSWDRETARLAQQAMPFLAFVPAGVLAPEFFFGSPGPVRIVMVLGLCLILFAVMRSQVSGWLMGRLVWIERHASVLIVTLVGAHAIVTFALVAVRHYYYNPVFGEDTGYYNQIFWSTIHGDFFRGSLTQARYSDPPIHSEFAAHSSPVLFLLLPVYWVHPSFYTLLVMRNLALSASALPIYFLAKARLGGVVALCLAACYLVTPNLLYQSVSAFYPLQFAVLFLPLTFLFFDRARFSPFVVVFLLALWVREEIALTAVLFTVYALLLRRSWRWVVTPVVLGIIWWYISIHLIMVPSKIMMEDLEEFFQVFPDGYRSAAGVLLQHPVEFLRLIFTADSLAYLYELLKSTAGMALATPAIFFVIPTTLINLVVGAFWKTTISISSHYSLVTSVCFSVAMVFGLAQFARLHRLFRTDERAFALALVLLLVPPALLGVKDVAAYGGGRNQTLLTDFQPRPYYATLDRIIRIIEADPEMAVTAPNILLPQLSQRRELYNTSRLWWYGTPRLDYIVVDSDVHRFDQGERHRARYQALITAIHANPAHRLLLDEHGFRLYRVEQTPSAGSGQP